MKFNAQKNYWTVMKKMITARSFFASGVINGKIYVADGNSTNLYELNSAEVMDPKKGIWHSIANMHTNMASYDAAVLDGKLLVTKGWF
ncbi:putative kelch-type beta propeller [Helianthus annuus]|nr:putative kelch-type beta propeller [Helianthus annuus]KAJ0674514.1 putative kelch-type beta propeller [Helianthus annuus]